MERNDYIEALYNDLVGVAPARNEPVKQEMVEERLVEERLVEERLPFTVRVVDTEEALRKAVYIRHEAYARHVPAVAERLKSAEPLDHDEDCVVLLAESKLDGSPVGTMRIQVNRYGKLCLEQSVQLPAWLQHASLAEPTRLGVAQDRTGTVVKTTLFKALYQYCLQNGVDWMVIAARAPLDKQYRALLFQDVYPGGEFIPMAHAGNIPHRVLAFHVASARTRWAQAKHPLFKFVFETQHPDINLGHATGSLPRAGFVDRRITTSSAQAVT